MNQRVQVAGIVTCTALAIALLAGPPANAAVDADLDQASNGVLAEGAATSGFTSDAVPTFGIITQRKVVNASRIATNYINFSRELATCKALSSNLNCSISATASATRTIDLAFGISWGAVSGSLGISPGSSVSVSAQCATVKLKAGQWLVAYAMGSRYRYKVRETQARNGIVLSDKTSGWLYAFNPYPAGVACRIV